MTRLATWEWYATVKLSPYWPEDVLLKAEWSYRMRSVRLVLWRVMVTAGWWRRREPCG